MKKEVFQMTEQNSLLIKTADVIGKPVISLQGEEPDFYSYINIARLSNKEYY